MRFHYDVISCVRNPQSLVGLGMITSLTRSKFGTDIYRWERGISMIVSVVSCMHT